MGSRSRKPFEEFDPADDTSLTGRFQALLNVSASTAQSSYDVLASGTGSTASDLRKWAKIRRLTPNCRLYDSISDYVTNSCAAYKISVGTIYKIERSGERDPFDEKYRILLWHGTSPTAIPGIIQTGFRMGTGGLFGGGIYFADRIAKSAGYVTKTGSGTAYFILAEIAPGRVYKAHHFHSDYSTAPKGFDSVKGNGSQIPNWKENKSYFGAILPCGGTTQNTRHQQYDMPWNEYILYDADRIIVRFVVECKM